MSRSYRFRPGDAPANLELRLFAALAGHHDQPRLVRHPWGSSWDTGPCGLCQQHHWASVLGSLSLDVPEGALVAELVRRGWPAQVARRRVRYHRHGWWWRHCDGSRDGADAGTRRARVRACLAHGEPDAIERERPDRGWCNV